MSTSTPIPSSHGELHPSDLARQAKEVRIHTAMRGLYGLYGSLIVSFGHDVVAEAIPVLRRQPETPKIAPVAAREVAPAPRQITPVDVEVAAGQRNMLEDDPEDTQNIDIILRMINEIHEGGSN